MHASVKFKSSCTICHMSNVLGSLYSSLMYFKLVYSFFIITCCIVKLHIILIEQLDFINFSKLISASRG